MTTFLGDWGPHKPVRPIKRIVEGEKESVAVKMIITTFCPDGTEKYSGFKVKLFAGITYSLPPSVAEILLKRGEAKRA